jgi:hypothetical protein
LWLRFNKNTMATRIGRRRRAGVALLFTAFTATAFINVSPNWNPQREDEAHGTTAHGTTAR